MTFEVLEGSLMCVWCLLGLGVMRSGPIALWAVGISQD